MDRPQLTQGHTGLVRVSTNRRSRVSGAIQDRPLGFVSLDGLEHVSFVGIRATADAGTQPISITIRTEDDQQVTLHSSVLVTSGDYQRETIYFSPSVAKLLDPEIMEPELLRLAKVYGAFTPEIAWEGAFDWPFTGPITSEFGTRRNYASTIPKLH